MSRSMLVYEPVAPSLMQLSRSRQSLDRLAGYMLRAPISLEKMTYHAATGDRRARFNSGRVFYPVTNHQIGSRC